MALLLKTEASKGVHGTEQTTGYLVAMKRTALCQEQNALCRKRRFELCEGFRFVFLRRLFCRRFVVFASLLLLEVARTNSIFTSATTMN